MCGAPTKDLGAVHGDYAQRDFRLARCAKCGFAFVVDPWLDYADIYDERYYEGRGADPLVDYRFELEHPARTIRRYEWNGIAQVVADLTGRGTRERRWLDYGAGNGAFVRYLREHGVAEAVGFDEGAIAARAREHGIGMLTARELDARAGQFDVVSAVEVLEHTLDPVAELRRMRTMLRSGGLLFLTTGNAAPFADRLASWRYVRPEIHIAYFEPRTLVHALTLAGFRAEKAELGPGFDDILKFKVLKGLRVRRRSLLTDALPAYPLARLAERVAHLSDHPIGWAD